MTLSSDTRAGVIYAISAYLLWGIAPIYFKLIPYISPSEILMHRIIWSFVLLLIIVLLTRRWASLCSILKQPGILFKLALSASFLAINWFMFIWAINNNHILDASLGYFINPLLSVALGVFFLSEHLRKWQILAVLLAVIGVIIQVIMKGSLPLVSLALAGTFGFYGLLRKQMHIDTFVGLLVESMFMLPIAIIYWLFFVTSPSSNMIENTASLNITLIMAGVVTTAPLLCFTAATKRLTLSALGLFQYIGPSIMFLLATFYYQETLQSEKLITFIFIWSALVIFSVDSLRAQRINSKYLSSAYESKKN